MSEQTKGEAAEPASDKQWIRNLVKDPQFRKCVQASGVNKFPRITTQSELAEYIERHCRKYRRGRSNSID